MKFIFADCLDQIDPGYDLLADRHSEGRKPYWDDQYPHEYFGYAPYDGILVSRGIVGDHRFKGKYSLAQAMRFARVGARKFLRFNGEQFSGKDLFGDCGAFSYAQMEEPPYTPEEIVDFYGDGGFTHGCSVDHIIFDFDPKLREMEGGSENARRRFEITLANAEKFLSASKALGPTFTPIGVVQGWSAGSMGEGARRLEAMGYSYIALGGMVPLRAESIHLCLRAVRQKVSDRMRIHILGFAKAEQIDEFAGYGITSFDTTSPLIRAFKDARANYYLPRVKGELEYFPAIRVPQALENSRFLNAVKEGLVKQEDLCQLEVAALTALRSYDLGKQSFDDTVAAVLRYTRVFICDTQKSTISSEKKFLELREQVERTLRERPWKRCQCRACKDASIDVVIFRGNNRNRRRGFHNLGVFHQHVKGILGSVH